MSGVLRVAVPVPLPQLFDYLPPRGIDAASIAIGSRVAIPFGSGKRVGIVIETLARSELPLSRLKPAIALLDDEPAINGELLATLQWVSRYYLHPLGEVLDTALPVGLAPRQTTARRRRYGANARTGCSRTQIARRIEQRGALRSSREWPTQLRGVGRANACMAWCCGKSAQARIDRQHASQCVDNAERAHRSTAAHAGTTACRGSHRRIIGRLRTIPTRRHHRQRQNRGLPRAG